MGICPGQIHWLMMPFKQWVKEGNGKFQKGSHYQESLGDFISIKGGCLITDELWYSRSQEHTYCLLVPQTVPEPSPDLPLPSDLSFSVSPTETQRSQLLILHSMWVAEWARSLCLPYLQGASRVPWKYARRSLRKPWRVVGEISLTRCYPVMIFNMPVYICRSQPRWRSAPPWDRVHTHWEVPKSWCGDSKGREGPQEMLNHAGWKRDTG